MKKFEIGKHGETPKFNAWFSQCSKEQVPYVIVKNKTKYSTIEWDYINFNPGMDKLFVENGEYNKSLFLEIFRKYANDKSEYTMSSLTLFVQKIPIENSKLFAEELYDLLNGQVN